MKYIYKLAAICLLSATLGCSDKFLDEPAPTDQVSTAVIFGSTTGVEAYISGIMRRFRGQFWRGAHDAGGLNSVYYARTVKGNDIVQARSWFFRAYERIDGDPTRRRIRFTWNFPYYMIGQANALIAGLEASTALSDAEKKPLLGQGKALRAFFYFQLAQEFQHTYTYDPNLPAPPIYTKQTTEGKPMSTLKEMYDLILDDLKYATENLTEDRLGKSYINVRAANGILARVYQTMHNWQGAEAAAKKAYGGGAPNSVLDAPSYKKGFNDYTNIEWIWGSAQSTDQSNYYYGAPHSHADHRIPSYSATYFNNDFVALFSDTDVRNTFYHKFSDVPASDYRNWITTKFKFTFDADHPIIRTPEMLLVEAEAKYHNGDPSGAHDLLFALQSNRDPKAVKSKNTGQDLLDEILVERRKEMYAEFGVEWFDAKRYRKGITRTGNHRGGALISLKPDDKRFFFKIPQEEIDANDKITDSVNQGR